MKLPMGGMMGDPSELQLIQLLLKATGAKKYLEVGKRGASASLPAQSFHNKFASLFLYFFLPLRV